MSAIRLSRYKAEALTYLDLTPSRLSFALIDLPSVYHPLGVTRSNPVALVWLNRFVSRTHLPFKNWDKHIICKEVVEPCGKCISGFCICMLCRSHTYAGERKPYQIFQCFRYKLWFGHLYCNKLKLRPDIWILLKLYSYVLSTFATQLSHPVLVISRMVSF